MARNTKYLLRYKEIIEKIAEKHGISKEKVETIIDNFFFKFKEAITDRRMPKIQITNFGTFKPSIGKINFNLRRSYKNYKLGRITKERLIQRIQNVWLVKQRLIQEKLGKNTWKEWKNKKDAEK